MELQKVQQTPESEQLEPISNENETFDYFDVRGYLKYVGLFFYLVTVLPFYHLYQVYVGPLICCTIILVGLFCLTSDLSSTTLLKHMVLAYDAWLIAGLVQWGDIFQETRLILVFSVLDVLLSVLFTVVQNKKIFIAQAIIWFVVPISTPTTISSFDAAWRTCFFVVFWELEIIIGRLVGKDKRISTNELLSSAVPILRSPFFIAMLYVTLRFAYRISNTRKILFQDQDQDSLSKQLIQKETPGSVPESENSFEVHEPVQLIIPPVLTPSITLPIATTQKDSRFSSQKASVMTHTVLRPSYGMYRTQPPPQDTSKKPITLNTPDLPKQPSPPVTLMGRKFTDFL